MVPGPELVRPAYGTSTLSELLPGVAARLGVPGYPDDVLGLPPAERYVVVLVDGLGTHLLDRSPREAPFLTELASLDRGRGTGPRVRNLTAGVPSTTGTSLASLGVGLPPGQHGLVGYSSRVPGTDRLLNVLNWDAAVDPLSYQSQPTVFERAARDGVDVSSVALARFAGSGLTRAALRGPRFVGFADEYDTERRIELVVAAATGTGDPSASSLVYAYERQLDHAGHLHGVGSTQWRSQLIRIDDWCAGLREALPDDVRLIITGDHGMIDVPSGHRLVVEDEPDLLVGVSALAGEGRFRQLYLHRSLAGRVAEVEPVAARWAEALGERAWVRTRTEAIDDGWFGPVAEAVLPRYGDVLVAMRTDWAVMSRRFPRELSLIGMHGSLTAAEMTVPLLCA